MSLFRDGERISRQAAILHLRSYFLHFSPDSVMLFCKKFSSHLVQFMHVTCANQIRRSADMSSLATHEATTDPRDLERKTTLSNGSLSMSAWMCSFHFFVAHCLCMVLVPRSTAMSPLQKTPKRRFTDSSSILLILGSCLLENSYYLYNISIRFSTNARYLSRN